MVGHIIVDDHFFYLVPIAVGLSQSPWQRPSMLFGATFETNEIGRSQNCGRPMNMQYFSITL